MNDAIFSNRKLPISAVRMRSDEFIRNFCIANEGDLSKKQRADRI